MQQTALNFNHILWLLFDIIENLPWFIHQSQTQRDHINVVFSCL